MERGRFGGLFFVRDWSDPVPKIPLPWARVRGGLDFVQKKTKQAIRKAGVRGELSFTSFRHGGLTELGDADLTDTQIRALSPHLGGAGSLSLSLMRPMQDAGGPRAQTGSWPQPRSR